MVSNYMYVKELFVYGFEQVNNMITQCILVNLLTWKQHLHSID